MSYKSSSIAPSVTLLIGPACVGKSSYIQNRPYDFVVSSDNIVDEICKLHKLSYSQFFELNFNNPIRKKQRQLFNQAIEESKNYRNIVWDLTNLTRKDRAKVSSHYPSADFTAIEFAYKGWEEDILQLSHERAKLTGKVIPDQVLFSMFKRHEPVSQSEGFSQIISVNMISLIINSRNAA